jgi:hypothetical protein
MPKGTGGMNTRATNKTSHSSLEAQREILMLRLRRLHPTVAKSPGYRTARNLLGPKYMTASLSARLKILQAANFLLGVLEMTPF